MILFKENIEKWGIKKGDIVNLNIKIKNFIKFNPSVKHSIGSIGELEKQKKRLKINSETIEKGE